MIIKNKNIKDLKEICNELVQINFLKFFLLIGTMGSGKTTFVRNFLEQLSHNSLSNIGFEVSSPSYNICNIYEGIYWHYDFYRMKMPIAEAIIEAEKTFIELQPESPIINEIKNELKNFSYLILFFYRGYVDLKIHNPSVI